MKSVDGRNCLEFFLPMSLHLCSCSVDGSSVYTQDDIAPERDSQFAKQTPNLEGTSPVMISPQQTSEPKEGGVHVQIDNIDLRVTGVTANDIDSTSSFRSC